MPLAESTVAKPIDGSNSTAILLLNLGGPDSLDAIITLPKPIAFLQNSIAWAISKYRAPASREGYKVIGGASPQLATTRAQASALVEALAEKGVDARAYVAMRYWYPFTDDAVREMIEAGHRELVILPLYPQFSVSTSGSSLRVLEDIFYSNAQFARIQSVVIPAWYNRPGYVSAMARLIEEQLLSAAFLPAEQAAACAAGDEAARQAARALASEAHVFFSAHGLPQKYVTELGDPYQAQTEATVNLVMAQLREWGYTNDHNLAYQSRVGPVQWLQPYTDVMIPELCERGVKKLCVVPVSFVSEHIETLEEIDCEYKELALESGIEQWARVPALGLDVRFIDALADAVIEALPGLKVPTVRAINEGTPVSLRIINDLVALARKEELKIAPKRQRYGFNENAELINGRIAMAAISLFGLGMFPSLLEMVARLAHVE
ncbi:ferrochelatase [Pavlovales sp. CCMP2436]|nr:ferrochelatase [Pavlovales sp. CCMP2436]